ncbi:MAG: DegV family protein [Solobacterium sp.]|nr:DegV family protein [Solobacterium sp.]
MSTAVVTDTNSGFTVEEGKQLGIFVIPMPVIIDGKDFLEGVNITHEDVYAAMAEGKDVSTSQASAGSVMDVWDGALKTYDSVVYIPMSSGLSGQCETGRLMARKYGGRVKVADNRRISVTQYQAVLDAKKYADSGMSAEEIAQKLEEDGPDASIYITVKSIEYLKKSGRITPAAVTLASLLHIVPVLTIRGGKLDAFERVRGMKTAVRHMITAVHNDLDEYLGRHPSADIIVAVSGTMTDPLEVQTVVEAMKKEFPDYEVFYRPLSCSIACHTGPGAVGVAFMAVNH